MKTLLFHRHYHGFTGGHLKHWDYFNHSRYSQMYCPAIYFTPNSRWEPHNPWLSIRNTVAPTWQPDKADMLFLAGMDWQAYPPSQETVLNKPVINLIQGVRHADPQHPLFAFLQRKAIRICVGPEVAGALKNSGQVKGPIHCIPNAIDLTLLPKPESQKSNGLLILAKKTPAFGESLYQRLQQLELDTTLVTNDLPRADYLALMNQYHLVLPLPKPTEGFFLPALEAMALGALVICPDAQGNRSFCLHGHNCFRPDYSLDAIVQAVLKAHQLGAAQRQAMQQAAQKTLEQHQMARERQAFLAILSQAEQVWKTI